MKPSSPREVLPKLQKLCPMGAVSWETLSLLITVHLRQPMVELSPRVRYEPEKPTWQAECNYTCGGCCALIIVQIRYLQDRIN